jgi:hypothetical protein
LLLPDLVFQIPQPSLLFLQLVIGGLQRMILHDDRLRQQIRRVRHVSDGI